MLHKLHASLFLTLCVVIPAHAQEIEIPSNLSAITPADLRDAALAFINISTSPGLEGAQMEVETKERNSDIWRSSLGFNAEFALPKRIVRAYWGGSINSGALAETIAVKDDRGDNLLINIDRSIQSLRATGGLSFPINQHLKIKPHFNFVYSQMNTDSELGPLIDLAPQQSDFYATIFSSSLDALSSSGAIETTYHHWFGERQLELGAQYSLTYTDTVSESNRYLDTWHWSQNAQAKLRYSFPTKWKTFDKPWRWNMYAQHFHFLNQNKRAIGFTYYSEVGLGTEWQANLKPLNWFGLQFIGVKGGVLKGDNVSGYKLGLTLR